MFLSKLNEVLVSKRSFVRDATNFIGFGIAGLLNIIHWTILYIKIKPGRESVLLHYNVIFGPDFVEKSLYLYYIPLLSTVLLIFNVILASIFYRKERLSSYFLAVASIAMQLIFFAATFVLILANA